MMNLHLDSDPLIIDDRWLSHLDPRLKLLFLLLLVVTIFSAKGFAALFVVGVLAIATLVWQPSLFRYFLTRVAYIRWLLLFTLFLHIFLTPGRTLLGLRMLSYDGLLRGLMVDLQLVLALFFTLCFTLYTQPVAVARATEGLLRPLRFLGLPVAEISRSLVLVLHFLPLVFQRGLPLVRGSQSQAAHGIVERLQLLTRQFGEVILALVQQADSLALEISRGENPLKTTDHIFCWRHSDSLCGVIGLLFILICWGL